MEDASSVLFLTADEIATLTGRKLKSKQVEALRAMGVPFRVNACGRPVVTRLAVEGASKKEAVAKPKWQPSF